VGLESFGIKIKIKRMRLIGVFMKENFLKISKKGPVRKYILMEINF
jgi:hypothetical protein